MCSNKNFWGKKYARSMLDILWNIVINRVINELMMILCCIVLLTGFSPTGNDAWLSAEILSARWQGDGFGVGAGQVICETQHSDVILTADESFVLPNIYWLINSLECFVGIEGHVALDINPRPGYNNLISGGLYDSDLYCLSKDLYYLSLLYKTKCNV